MPFWLVIWEIIAVVQSFFGFGTAYRSTKNGGDNGIALYGWLIAYSFAALIPGLGFYLWYKSRETESTSDEDWNEDR